jgi:hypothetical protein
MFDGILIIKEIDNFLRLIFTIGVYSSNLCGVGPVCNINEMDSVTTQAQGFDFFLAEPFCGFVFTKFDETLATVVGWGASKGY